jgi:acylphosphatase
MDPHVARHVHVEGRVQGVGFRWHTRAEARALGVTGWVKNLDDGRVEAWLEGHEASVEALIVWLRSGPSGAAVEEVSVAEVKPRHVPSFDILR